MKKTITICLTIFILIISLCILSRCTASESSTISHDRFELVLDEGIYEVIYDRKTNVQYLVIDCKSGNAITLLVDHNGDPLLYRGE